VKLEGAELAEFLENEREKARQAKLTRKSLDSDSRFSFLFLCFFHTRDKERT